jgi:hypothetical protein
MILFYVTLLFLYVSLLFGGWATCFGRHVAHLVFNPMAIIDGIQITDNELIGAFKRVMTREKLRAAQKARAKRYGIQVLQGGALTIPARLVRLGAREADFADPVNYKYPVWLSKPDRDALTPTQLGQVRNAPARFAQFRNTYNPKSRAAVDKRIAQALKRFGIGEFSKVECIIPIAKIDAVKQIVYGVALRPNVVDSQRDFVRPDEIERAAHGFLLNSRKADLQHRFVLPLSDAAPVESHIARVDEPPNVLAGDWVIGMKIFDKRIWQDVVEGRINGFSIKGRGTRRAMLAAMS